MSRKRNCLTQFSRGKKPCISNRALFTACRKGPRSGDLGVFNNPFSLFIKLDAGHCIICRDFSLISENEMIYPKCTTKETFAIIKLMGRDSILYLKKKTIR